MKVKLAPIMKAWIVAGLVGVGLGVTFQNCGQPKYNIKDNTLTGLTETLGSPLVNAADVDTVCDPSATKTTLNGGLVAELFYMNSAGSGNATTVYNFFDPGMATKSPKQIYFSEINTIPQYWSNGFTTKTGDKVKDDSGNILTEWFALKYFSELRVHDASEEGFYEFANLADDGHIMEAQINGVWTRINDDDGLHAPKFGCSITTIEMKIGRPVPIRVYYYQGPATHIANMLMWRKVPTSALQGDIECGQTSSSYFYDLNTGTQLAPFTGLLARGWSVVPAEAFYLPDTVTNPCTK